MSELIRGALARFKAFVAVIEYNDDTLLLDRDLADASRMLYEVRHQIDVVWAEARAQAPKRHQVTPPMRFDNIALDEIVAALATVRGHKTGE